jgi:hypothetical protein
MYDLWIDDSWDIDFYENRVVVEIPILRLKISTKN